jgi:hypothetical protein
MISDSLFAWFDTLSLFLLGLVLIAALLLAAGAGFVWRAFHQTQSDAGGSSENQSQESSIVSGLLGLLTLLLAFTFSLAITRFEARRELVMADSNAIGTAYLRVQLLPEPHRTRLSGLLRDYTGNLLLLARARRDQVPALLAHDDQLLGDIWSATAAAYDGTKDRPFAISLLNAINTMIDADATRRGERLTRIPPRVLATLLLYIVITAAVLGYFLTGRRIRIAASVLMGLQVLSLLLIIDIDQPTRDSIVESQSPIEAVLGTIKDKPPGSYDRWRTAE